MTGRLHVRTAFIAAGIIAILAVFTSFGPNTTFTAVLQPTSGDPKDAGKNLGSMTYYVEPGKLRLDIDMPTPTGQQYRASSIILYDTTTVTSITLIPEAKQYITSSVDRKTYENDPSNNLDALFAAPDGPSGICASDPKVTCKKIGIETVAGRKAERWHVEGPNSSGGTDSGDVWYDPVLHFTVKLEDQSGSGYVAKEITTGTLADSLFTIPDGYNQMTK